MYEIVFIGVKGIKDGAACLWDWKERQKTEIF